MFLETYPFHLGWRICWQIVLHNNIVLWFFVFLWYQLLFLLFHFLFSFGDSLTFFLGEPGQSFVNFVFLFKEPALGFIDFFLLLFNLYVFSDLHYFLSSTDFRFFCSPFSNTFRWCVRLFIWDFSCFMRKACIAMNFLLITAFAASHRFCLFMLSLSFVSSYFLISSLISSLTHCFFSSMLFSLHVIVFFSFLFL